MLDQPVPNPLAKNPNVYTHKVFAAVGLILLGTVIVVSGIWYYLDSQKAKTQETTTQTTNDVTQDWETYKTPYNGKELSFKYPKDWQRNIELVDGQFNNANYTVSKGSFKVTFFNNKERKATISGDSQDLEENYTVDSRMVNFNGKDESATEKSSKAGTSWEIFPNSVGNNFSYQLYSSNSVPTQEETDLMLKIVSTFKLS